MGLSLYPVLIAAPPVSLTGGQGAAKHTEGIQDLLLSWCGVDELSLWWVSWQPRAPHREWRGSTKLCTLRMVTGLEGMVWGCVRGRLEGWGKALHQREVVESPSLELFKNHEDVALRDVVEMGWWLDLIILEVFSDPNGSMTLLCHQPFTCWVCLLLPGSQIAQQEGQGEHYSSLFRFCHLLVAVSCDSP